MSVRVNGPVLDVGARRVFAKIVIAFPVLRRSNGSRHKAATAVRADIAQDGINTRGTERTLISTDACFKRIRWQRLVAMLAGWSEFKHGFSLP
jgi:hypothetical protein